VRNEYSRETYQAGRDRFYKLKRENQTDWAEAALLFCYLNRIGHHGPCRFDHQGLFNVPFGKYKAKTFMANLRQHTYLLENREFGLGDFS